MAVRPAEPQPHRFTVAEYHRMGEAGIFAQGSRVELIEGEVVEMVPIGSDHASVVDRLTRFFVQGLGERAIVRVQNPVRLNDLSEPQPDLTLLKPVPDFYKSRHPGPQDALLVVEVADSSLSFDKGRKLPLYARMGITEAWIVVLQTRTIEICRGPAGDSYRDTAVVQEPDRVSPAAFPDLILGVAEIFG